MRCIQRTQTVHKQSTNSPHRQHLPVLFTEEHVASGKQHIAASGLLGPLLSHVAPLHNAVVIASGTSPLAPRSTQSRVISSSFIRPHRGLHSDTLVNPLAVEKWSSGQAEHPVNPVLVPNIPTGQSMHSAPSFAANIPGLQASQMP